MNEEKVIIDCEKKKKKIIKEKQFHTHKGIIDCSTLGCKTINKSKFLVLEPDFVDYWDTKIRKPQAMLKKDIGIIITYTGLSPGYNVLEIGCGSGSLTMYLANIVKPDGKVIAIDKNEEHLKIARKNILRVKLENYVEFKRIDVEKNILQFDKNFDVIVIDIQNSEKIIEKILPFLKQGGYLVIFVLHLDKISKVVNELEKNNIFYYEIIEVIERKIIKTVNGFRPEISGILHTGYIIISRKS